MKSEAVWCILIPGMLGLLILLIGITCSAGSPLVAKVEILEPYVSPNGDGVKDLLRFAYQLGSSGQVGFRLYDRKGEQVLEETLGWRSAGVRYEEAWDCMPDGKPLPEGAYSLRLLLDGREVGERIFFIVDVTPPEILFISPSPGSKVPIYTMLIIRVKELSGVGEGYLIIDSDPENRVKLLLPSLRSPIFPLPPGRHSIEIHLVDRAGNETVEVVEYEATPVTEEIVYARCLPNPVRRGGKARFIVKIGAPTTEVELVLYDPAGRDVFRWRMPGEMGEHSIEWDGRDLRGKPLPRGVYFCRVRAENAVKTFRVGIR